MGNYYLGVDLGSSYTKYQVVDPEGHSVYRAVHKTLTRNRQTRESIEAEIQSRFHPERICSTGYGRNTYPAAIRKTELICASVGVSHLYPEQEKTILDIGGEDIKVIRSGPEGTVEHFSMNDKCSAGTGAFITEIAEKAELDLASLSPLARKSTSDRQINSFCTVFAKSEILTWLLDGVPLEDIARGIYLSILNRIRKLPLEPSLPLYLCGGVIAHHPYLQELLIEEMPMPIEVVPQAQYSIAYGAAIIAMKGDVYA